MKPFLEENSLYAEYIVEQKYFLYNNEVECDPLHAKFKINCIPADQLTIGNEGIMNIIDKNTF